jgi:histidinol phosphatase-like enzyme
VGERHGLVILDRDGVLNAMVVDAEHGTIDSPLHPSQVEVFPWVPRALARLAGLGFGLAIASNQPAAAKGKTTLSSSGPCMRASSSWRGPRARAS